MKMIVSDEEREVDSCHVEVKKFRGNLWYLVMVRCKTKHFGVYEWDLFDSYLDPEEALRIESKIKSILLKQAKSTLNEFSFSNLLDE